MPEISPFLQWGALGLLGAVLWFQGKFLANLFGELAKQMIAVFNKLDSTVSLLHDRLRDNEIEAASRSASIVFQINNDIKDSRHRILNVINLMEARLKEDLRDMETHLIDAVRQEKEKSE